MICLEDFTKRNCIDPSYGLSGIPWQEALVTILARRGDDPGLPTVIRNGCSSSVGGRPLLLLL